MRANLPRRSRLLPAVALAALASSCEGALVGGLDTGVRDLARSGEGRADRPAPGDSARGDAPGERGAVDHAAPPPDSAQSCAPIPGVGYGKLSTIAPYAGDAAKQGDMNLLLRGWKAVAKTKGLVDVSGPSDANAPQLYSLFADDRVPAFSAVYQVEAWDWSCNCPKGFVTDPEVTLAGLAVAPGEVIQTPKSGYDLGGGATAIVLHAAPGTITLKYTREDNVVMGYTIHLAGICIEPSLQALYSSLAASGRKELPALKNRQPLGRATGTEIQVAIRDTGSWMDPRVRKDWWQGR